jgi:hypothetical protein
MRREGGEIRNPKSKSENSDYRNPRTEWAHARNGAERVPLVRHPAAVFGLLTIFHTGVIAQGSKMERRRKEAKVHWPTLGVHWPHWDAVKSLRKRLTGCAGGLSDGHFALPSAPDCAGSARFIDTEPLTVSNSIFARPSPTVPFNSRPTGPVFRPASSG